MESVAVCIARWALLIISISCRVVALCGLMLNIAGKGNVIRSRDEYESDATQRKNDSKRERVSE